MFAATPTASSESEATLLKWLPVLIGLTALYAPTIYDLHGTLWNNEEHAHAPIVLLAAMWLLWQQRTALLAKSDRPKIVGGSVLLALGLFCYTLGRSQSVVSVEVASIIPVLAGALLLVKGSRALFAVSFPVLFLVFMVPLPGFIIIPLTGPLREYVSLIVEAVLHAFDYPIARSGVLLNIGSYRLLVADACSGINSMFAMMALGLLYLYLMRYRNMWHNGILLVSILPIAFTANIVRVLILVLVTYHFGDAAGQGVIHGLAGMLLFVIALVMLLVLDGVLVSAIFCNRHSRR